MINSRNLGDLTPATQRKASAFVTECQKQGIDVIITSTFRDAESQALLYQQGRRDAGPIVTNADAGHSFHQWRLAFDFVPVVNGKAVWNDNKLWAKCGAIGQALGLEWGGSWKFQDKPHFQNTGGVTIAQLLSSGKTQA